MNQSLRVLSIQSHVVFGYVGNKSATFPLQLLGFDVDVLNTVNFSNHTGYSHITGSKLEGRELKELLEGVFINELASYSYLLTGYLGTAGLVEATGEMVSKVKIACPGVTYVLDPVIGDNGKLYVSPEVIPIYRDVICPMADIITPNQFEAELLTEITILSIEDLAKVFDKFHKMGIKNVILTSCNVLPKSHSTSQGSSSENKKTSFMYASQLVDDKPVAFYIAYPQKNHHFIGTGDLLASLILGWYQKSTSDNISQNDVSSLGHLATACQFAISTVQKVLDNTLIALEQFPKTNLSEQKKKNFSFMSSELRIINSRDDIISPVVKHLAQPLIFE
ncbi:hypothetical protein DSO57_1009121 [Entomophthora muscae]|uniref:Uncharacterized protein n=1 Tax=Entomophthora muscae TaxID=34485 RepID=A0ACC2RY45_9FUNG|nr:hypothetical protein DSO57_1009121 [Entomophthora muscae]